MVFLAMAALWMFIVCGAILIGAFTKWINDDDEGWLLPIMLLSGWITYLIAKVNGWI